VRAVAQQQKLALHIGFKRGGNVVHEPGCSLFPATTGIVHLYQKKHDKLDLFREGTVHRTKFRCRLEFYCGFNNLCFVACFSQHNPKQ